MSFYLFNGLLYCHVSPMEALIATGLFLLNLYIVLIFSMFLFSLRKHSMYVRTCIETSTSRLFFFYSLNTTDM